MSMCQVIFSEPARLSRVRERNLPVAGLSRVGTDEMGALGAAGTAAGFAAGAGALPSSS